MSVDDEWIKLCTGAMFVISDACQQLLIEQLNDKPSVIDKRGHCIGCPPCTKTHWEHCPNHHGWPEDKIDRRRAELYKEHLDAAGIEIRRKA